MTPTKVRLFDATLHYIPGLQVHTAVSGPVPHLTSLYLVIDPARGARGVGETRTNITYLNGLSPSQVTDAACRMLRALPWREGRGAVLDTLERTADLPAPVRALVETALADAAARGAGCGVCDLFGAAEPGRRHHTNQSIFHGDAGAMMAAARHYVARGFRRLKVRLGLRSPDADRSVLLRLRDSVGPEVELACDLNGAWPAREVEAGLRAFAAADLAYVEQPFAADDWQAVANFADGAPVPIMLDETVSSPAAVDRVIAAGWRQLAHLKIVKLGGVDRVVACGRRLQSAGVGVMVGQMNEGGVATAAALHAALALRPTHAELYGADGLVDDPSRGLDYGIGEVGVAGPAGLGLVFDESSCHQIAEWTDA